MSIELLTSAFLGTTCPELTVPAFGEVRCSSDTKYESRCRIECQECHNLVGSEERICRADGIWSGIDGVCQRK